MASPAEGPARVERVFAGTYGDAEGAVLKAALGSAGPPAAAAVGGLAVAWTGPHAPAPPSAVLPACLLDGEIYNLEEIARLAQVRAHPEPEATLAAAYTRLGEGLVTHLRGEFALLLWDARSKTGLLARDQLGSGNLFLHVAAGRLLFASELTHLLEALPRTPAPDRQALVQWLAGGTEPADRTLYEGVVPLPPASLLRLGGGQWVAAPYWTPRYVEPRRLDVDEAAGELRRAVFGAVGRRLHGRRTAGILVSGGLDSGTVLAVADRLVGAGKASLHAYSAVFPDHGSMDESQLIQLQIEHHGLPGLQLPVTGGSPLRAALRYLDQWRVPLPVPGHFIWEPLLAAAAGVGAECMLDGEAGDELFGVAPLLLADRLRRGRLHDAVRLARSFPGAGRAPSRRLLASLLGQYGLGPCLPARLGGARGPAPHWLARADARRYRRTLDPEPWRSLEGPGWWAQLADTVIRGSHRLGFFDYYRRRGRANGMPAQHPFLDLDLIEVVLKLPPEHGFDASLTRPLLRRAMRGLVPEPVRVRRGKSYFDPLVIDCLAVDDRQHLSRLLTARDAEVLRFADGNGVRRLLQAGPEAHPNGATAWTREVWRLATAECWLRSQSERGFAQSLLDELPVNGHGRRALPGSGTRRTGRSYVSPS